MRRFQGIAASLFACACASACGKTTQLVDGGGGDSNTTDANTTIDATPMGDVTVTTYSRSSPGTDPVKTPKSGIQVVTTQPNGDAGPTGATDGSGKITLTGVLSGAAITAIYPTNYGFQLVTTMGVKPGDNLVYGDNYTSPQIASTGNVTIGFTAVTNAVNYYAYYGCGSQAQQTAADATSITLPITCADPKTNVALFAYDDVGTLLATGVLHDVVLTDGTTVALASWTPAAATGNFAESISGLGADIDQVNFLGSFEVAGATGYSSSMYVTPDSGGAAAAALTVQPGGDRIFTSATLNHLDNHVGDIETYRAEAGNATSSTFTAPTIPGLTNAIVSAGAQASSWLTVGKGPYDGTVAFLYWSRADGGDTSTEYDWNVIMPPGVKELDWSGAPPAGLADYLPTLQDQVYGDGMQLVDLSTTNGYDELRNAPEWQITDPGYSTETGEIPSGSMIADGGEGPFTGHLIRMQRRLIRQTTHDAIQVATHRRAPR